MIDYRSSKSGYGRGRCTECNGCGYSGMKYNLGNTGGSHMGNYSEKSSNNYDTEAKQ